MKKLLLYLTSAFASFVSSQAATIYWVSFHPDDNTPSGGAAGAGFTQAPDIGYTQLLRNSGHTVTRIVTSGTPDTALLNAAQLVIVSRSVPSGDYQDDPETAAWNGITAPMIILGAFVLRGGTDANARLGFTTGSTIADTTSTINLTATNPAHPIFTGISLDGTNTMVNPYANIVTVNGVTQRGVSVNTNTLAGNGTVLARVSASGTPASGTIIAEWQAGSTMGNSPPDTLGGHRLVFLTGSREPNGGVAETAGIFDLASNDANRLFLNAVNYMAVPEPSSALLLSTGAAVALLRRRRTAS